MKRPVDASSVSLPIRPETVGQAARGKGPDLGQSVRRAMPCRCRHRSSADRVRCGIDDFRARRQSSSRSRAWRRNATTIASSASASTLERGSVGPVLVSSAVACFRRFATAFGVMPTSQLSCASTLTHPRTDGGQAFDQRSLYCSPDDERGHSAPVTNLSHSASFHSFERITPSNRGVKHLDRRALEAKRAGVVIVRRSIGNLRLDVLKVNLKLSWVSFRSPGSFSLGRFLHDLGQSISTDFRHHFARHH